MKKIVLTMLLVLCASCLRAMNYEEARNRAWFLTDKMAYELNLTAEQYDRAYQINLDYFMSLRSQSDCIGPYWQYRDVDLRCILYDWQYNLYRTLDYFFRPVRWYDAQWYYPVFDHYRYGYYYFDRPNIYATYYGGMWRRRGHNSPSPYLAMRPKHGVGLRDQYRQGWIGGGNMPPHEGFRPNASNRHNGGHGNHSNPNWNGSNHRPQGGGNARPGGMNGNGKPNDGLTIMRPWNGNKDARPGVGNHTSGRPSLGEGYRGKQQNGNNGTKSNGFRDGYINYRQTGRSSATPINNRTGVTPNSRGNANAQSSSRGGRSFGGR